MDLLESDGFRQHAEALMKQYHATGLSISVSQDDGTFSTAFGLTHRDSQKQCTADTLYDIASSSKSLAAASVALLVEDEAFPEIQWETPLHDLLPEDFVMPTVEGTERVTVEDMLCHRTGLARHDSSYMGQKAKEPDTPRSITRNLRNLAMARPEKQKYMLYNNMMFAVATHLIQVKTGLSFSDFLRERILKPLAMNSTYLGISSAKAAGQDGRLAFGHHFDTENEKWHVFEAPNTPEDQGAGGIVTSSADHLKWVRAMLHRKHPITDAVYKALTEPRTFEGDDPDPFCSTTLYCLSLETYWYRGFQVIIHDGLIDGFASSHFFLPSHNFGGVLLGNASGAEQVTWILTREIIDAALGVPAQDWQALEPRTADEEDDNDQKEIQKIRDELMTKPECDMPPLEAFTGEYNNAGYHTFKVELGDEGMLIDAWDRSMPFVITFEHVRTFSESTDDATRMHSGMIARLATQYGPPFEYLSADFVFDGPGGGGGRATKMALRIEPGLVEGEMVWFERV